MQASGTWEDPHRDITTPSSAFKLTEMSFFLLKDYLNIALTILATFVSWNFAYSWNFLILLSIW